jgi:hypothetical protein
VFGGTKQVSPFDSKRVQNARIAGGVSLGVDVVVALILSTAGSPPRQRT